jgi:tetratricopeptide (TPR) repeat protein
MWLDADDFLREADLANLKKFKKSQHGLSDSFMLKYNTGFDENFNVAFTYYRERIVKRTKKFKWEGRVHECIVTRGNTIKIPDVAVWHMPLKEKEARRNLKIYEKMKEDGAEFSGRNLFYYARELMAAERGAEAVKIFEEYLDSGNGWFEDEIRACVDVSRYYKSAGNAEKAAEFLLRSLRYGEPTPESACEIGNVFLERKNYAAAIFWYMAAISGPILERVGFTLPDYQDYYPYVQMCLCYDRIGDRESALKYHELSKKIKPDSSAVLYNEKYFYGDAAKA